MKIRKSYHFYAAHRNFLLDDKCKNLHGHTYYVDCEWQFVSLPKIDGTLALFADIDRVIEPLFKVVLDHSVLMSEDDILKDVLIKHHQKVVILPAGTSVELLCGYIFKAITEINQNNRSIFGGGFLSEVSIKETVTSKVSMSWEYYQQPEVMPFFNKGMYLYTDKTQSDNNVLDY